MTQAVLYKIPLKSISITNYIFKLHFKYFSQLLLKSSTKYKIHLAKLIKIHYTFDCTYAKNVLKLLSYCNVSNTI